MKDREKGWERTVRERGREERERVGKESGREGGEGQ